jgi:LDH2 family malate/lactate/ureidoglycolate dehydrogenase
MNKITVASLTQFVLDVLTKYGVSHADALTTAEVLVTTDTWGVFTHGTKLLRGYGKRLKAGGLDPKGRPVTEREGPAWALVNGNSSIGMVTSVYAMKSAIDKARTSGVAFVTVHNSCHFGGAGYYAHMAAQENMVGMAMANDVPSVAAPGSKGPVMGSNPFAFSAPGGEYPPMILDISTAIVAGGKIRANLAAGKPIPSEWLVDSEGRPTSDGNLYPYQASLSPMAGHKGYGLAIMIDVLSGLMSGSSVRDKIGAWMDDVAKPTDHGHAFLAFSPSVISGGNTFGLRMSTLVHGIKESPTVPEAGGLKIPGEIEARKSEAAHKDGIPLPDDVWESIQGAAADAGIQPPE